MIPRANFVDSAGTSRFVGSANASVSNDQYNIDLSFKRARAVVEYLVAHGVPAERLSYEGYGELNPIAPNDSPEGRALNRRVEFTIIEPSDTRPQRRR